MADNDKKEPEFEEDPILPSAEIDPNEFKKGDNNEAEDKKDEEEAETEYKAPPRIPKEDPGDGKPKNPVDKIEFLWNKKMETKSQCDTLHMLYLLQLALEAVRERTVERNKYFKSIGRTDRFINQLDAPQIISNFLEWHNKDKDKNLFDGDLLEKTDKLTMINDIISKIGGVKKGPATKIYTKLRKEVQINARDWMDTPAKKLYLETWGWTKMYKGETVLEEASTDQLVTCLTYNSGTGVPDVSKYWTWPEQKEETDPTKAKKQKDELKKLAAEEDAAWQQDGVVRGVCEEFLAEQSVGKKPAKEGDEPIFKKKNPLIYLHCIGLSEDALKAEPYKFDDEDAKAFYELDPNGKNQEVVRKWREKEGREEKDDISDFWVHRLAAYVRGEESIVPDGDFKPLKPNAMDGPSLAKAKMGTANKELMSWLIPKTVKNAKDKPTQNILNGATSGILKKLKKCYIFGILDAAQKQKK